MFETRVRVPRGDVVQTIWSTTVGGVGATVVDVSNERDDLLEARRPVQIRLLVETRHQLGSRQHRDFFGSQEWQSRPVKLDLDAGDKTET